MNTNKTVEMLPVGLVGDWTNGRWQILESTPEQMVIGFYVRENVGPSVVFSVKPDTEYPTVHTVEMTVQSYCDGYDGILTDNGATEIGTVLGSILEKIDGTNTFVGILRDESLYRSVFAESGFISCWNGFRFPGLSPDKYDDLNRKYSTVSDGMRMRIRMVRPVDLRYRSRFADWETASSYIVSDVISEIWDDDNISQTVTRTAETLRSPNPVFGGFLKLVTDGDNVLVSYLPDNRPITNGSGYESSGRMRVKLGKYLRKLNPSTPDTAIENVVNRVKSYVLAPSVTFEMYRGYDILTGYHGENYAPFGLGDLAKSCMRYDECQSYVEWYAENRDAVSLCVALNPDGLVLGRTLVWTDLDGNRTHDRVYGTEPVQRMIYAHLSESGITRTVSPVGIRMRYASNDMYPYMDTYHYGWCDSGYLILHETEPENGYQRYYAFGETNGDYTRHGGISCHCCGYDIEPGDELTASNGTPYCADCASRRICTECESDRDVSRYGTDDTPLCDGCAAEYVCAGCGDYEPDGLSENPATYQRYCESCIDSYCPRCGDVTDSTGEDCNACKRVTPCAACGTSRSHYHAVGSYCDACKPRNLELDLFTRNHWNEPLDTGTFQTITGDRAYHSTHCGFDCRLRTWYPSNLGVTYRRVYLAVPVLPGWESLAWSMSGSTCVVPLPC